MPTKQNPLTYVSARYEIDGTIVRVTIYATDSAGNETRELGVDVDLNDPTVGVTNGERTALASVRSKVLAKAQSTKGYV